MNCVIVKLHYYLNLCHSKTNCTIVIGKGCFLKKPESCTLELTLLELPPTYFTPLFQKITDQPLKILYYKYLKIFEQNSFTYMICLSKYLNVGDAGHVLFIL